MKSSAQATYKRTEIFAGSRECLNLAVPIVFILAGLAFGSEHLAHQTANWLIFASAVFGLNVIHNGFSLGILFLPELKEWRKAKARESILHRTSTWVALSVSILIYFQFREGFTRFVVNFFWSGQTAHQIEEKALFCVYGVTAYITIAHGLWQSYGLAVLYNLSSPSQSSGVAKLERVLMKAHCFFAPFPLVFYDFLVDSPHRFPIIIIMCTLCLLIVCVSFLTPNWRQSNKTLFQLRVFLVPLVLYSFMGVIGLAVTHGFEYWCVYRKMTERSKAPSLESVKRLTGLAVAIVFGFLIFRPGQFGGLPVFSKIWPQVSPGLKRIILEGSLGMACIHHFIDSRIFHFSDRVTRSLVAPLLVEHSDQAEKQTSKSTLARSA